MKTLQTTNLLPFLALASLFIKISGSSSLHPVLTGPDMAFLGTRLTFRCIAPDSSPPVTYELQRDDGVFITAGTDEEGNHSIPLSMKVTATSEGSYYCKATAEGSTGVSNSIKLSVVTPASNTRVTSDPFPPVAYVGSRFELSCDVTRGSHLSYAWFFNKKQITSSISSSLHLTGNKLVMGMVTPEHAGDYSCLARTRVHDIERISSSTEVHLMVKVYVSKPRISFSISKEGDSYRGNVTCWSTAGSLPVNFSLSLDGRKVGSITATESLAAWFPVAMVPGLDMGIALCSVNTEVQELMSEPVTLVVVPVRGDVKMEVEYLYRTDYKLAAVRLSCQVSRGTFPYISWLLNGSVLPSVTHEDSHLQPVPSHSAMTDDGRILFLAMLGPEQSGYYRCRARDSYDDSGPWVKSADVLVQVTDRILNSMPQATSPTETPPRPPMAIIEVIAISLCCFLLLMLAAGVACWYKMSDHRQAHAHSATANSDALPLSETESQSGGQQADISSTDYNVQNQAEEIKA